MADGIVTGNTPGSDHMVREEAREWGKPVLLLLNKLFFEN
jgi:hypothetical protein